MVFIDPLSGPFANIGKLMLNHIQVPLQDINAKGGILKGTPLQLLQFDSKLAAQESISALQSATTRARWAAKAPVLPMSRDRLLTIEWE